MNKKTLIIGASDNPARYSYKAAKKLAEHGFEFLLMGLKKNKVLGQDILPPFTVLHDIDTVTMYIRPELQEEYKEYLISLKPRRVIFNPGTENKKLEEDLIASGIEVVENCTLVMLTLKQF